MVAVTFLIGQERALKAIQFGTDIKSHDYNMFVLGPPASGKTTAVKAHLGPRAAQAATPLDWVYVVNFENPNRPKALKLPPGRAKDLAKGMIAALDELRGVLPVRFESEDYQTRRRAIDEQFRSGNEEALEALSKKANAQNIALLRTPTGFAMAPMHEGKVVKPEVFNALPEAMRRDVENKIAALEKELAVILERLPKAEKRRRQQLSELNEEVATSAIRDALFELHGSFSDVPDAAAYLEAAGHDMVRNVGLFLATGEEENAIVRRPIDSAQDPRFRRYLVNVMAANGAATAYAVARMLADARLSLQDFDFYEIHEAFAAQVLCTLKAWESERFCRERLGLAQPLGTIDRSKMNVKGGSVAIGHPFAATGARILATLAKLLATRGNGRGLISICTAGGMGVTAIVER